MTTLITAAEETTKLKDGKMHGAFLSSSCSTPDFEGGMAVTFLFYSVQVCGYEEIN